MSIRFDTRPAGLARASLALVLGVALSAGPAAVAEPVPGAATLFVDAPQGLDGSRVVRGGVPVPEALGVLDTARLSVWEAQSADDRLARPVPAQFRVLSRWSGTRRDATRPVKWVLVDFAGEPGVRYELRTDAGGGPLQSVEPVGREDAAGVSIDTGLLRFRVPRDRFAPLAGLDLRAADGARLELGATSGVDVEMTAVRQRVDGTLEERDFALSRTVPRRVHLEENGPLRAVVAIEGDWTLDDATAPTGGVLGYTLRVEAEAGSSTVRLVFVLSNDGAYGPPTDDRETATRDSWLHTRGLTLSVPVGLSGATLAAVASDAVDLDDATRPPVRLLQSHADVVPADERANFAWTLSTGEPAVIRARGTRSGGGLLVAGADAAATGVLRHFWQQHPSAVSFADGKLAFELWPGGPTAGFPRDLHSDWGPAYQFEGGRQKSWEMHVRFEGREPAEPSRSVGRLEASVAARAAIGLEPEWVRLCGVLGDLPRAVGTLGHPELDAAAARLDGWTRSLVDPDPDGGPQDGLFDSIVARRESRDHGHEHYGFMDFGDLAHDEGYCSGHHDWVRGLLLQWLRTGERAFLDHGLEMAAHRADVDQYHSTDRTQPGWRRRNGFQRAARGLHGRELRHREPFGEFPPDPSGTWLEGLLLAYAVTGDERAFDAARENAEAFVAWLEDEGEGLGEAGATTIERIGSVPALSRAVGALVAYHEFTGERRFLEDARRAFERGLLQVEEICGNRGTFHGEGQRDDLRVELDALDPLIRYHRATGDKRALALLLRILTWLRESVYAGTGRTVGDAYLPLQLPAEAPRAGVDAADWDLSTGFLTADAYAYAHHATGEPSHLRFARQLFRDSVLFLDAEPARPVRRGFAGGGPLAKRRLERDATRVGAWILNRHMVFRSVAQQAASTGVAAADLPLAGFAGTGRHVREPTPAAEEEAPAPPPPSPPTPVVKEDGTSVPSGPTTLIVDDDEAALEGPWTTHSVPSAYGDRQRLAAGTGPSATATFTARVERSGQYRVYAAWGTFPSAASTAQFEIRHADGIDVVSVNQAAVSGRWRLLGQFLVTTASPLVVRIRSQGGGGDVAADAVKLEAVR